MSQPEEACRFQASFELAFSFPNPLEALDRASYLPPSFSLKNTLSDRRRYASCFFGCRSIEVEFRVEGSLLTVSLYVSYFPFLPKRISKAIFFGQKSRWQRCASDLVKRWARDLEVIKTYSISPLKILVSGSHGLIGSALSLFLRRAGHEVFSLERGIFSTNSPPLQKKVIWNPQEERADHPSFEGFDVVIHLAGKRIGLWGKKNKRDIAHSRIHDTKKLVEILQRLKKRPRLFMSASAVGIYASSHQPLTEQSPLGSGFLAELCKEWERASLPLENIGVRRVIARFGIVFSSQGGMLKNMIRGCKWAGGIVLGGGAQILPWIHLDDVVYALYHLLVREESVGCYNLCSLYPENMKKVTQLVCRAVHRPFWGSIPAKWIKKGASDLARELLLSSLPVFPARLREEGFSFTYSTLRETVEQEVGRWP